MCILRANIVPLKHMSVFTRVLSIVAVSVFLCCVCARGTRAQCSGDNISDDQHYRVRDVTVNALFGSVPAKLKRILAKHKNEVFQTAGGGFVVGTGPAASEGSLTIFKQEVKSFFEQDGSLKNDDGFGVDQTQGVYIRATFLTTCVKIVPVTECNRDMAPDARAPVSKCVDVVVKIRVIPVNTASPSSNLLELARSNQVRFFGALPRPLLVLDPKFGIEYDKDYGPSLAFSTSTEFFSLPSVLKGNPEAGRTTQLKLSLNGRKSLKSRYYDANARVVLSLSRNLKLFQKAAVTIGFAADERPRGDGVSTKNELSVGANTTIRLKSTLLDQVNIGADYRRSYNRFSSGTGIAQRATENALAARAIADGRLFGGFIRGALWVDHATPNGGADSYSRAAGIFGFARSFNLPQKRCRIVGSGDDAICEFPATNPPAIGVEMLAGAGKAWGTVPQYARFFGGNTTGSFLYDSVDEGALNKFPESVLIRSFGNNRAGAGTIGTGQTIGGTSYRHFNLSVSLPVKAWSRPLIPAVSIGAPDGSSGPASCSGCTSLKDVLKNQVSKGRNIYVDAMAMRSLTDQQREDLGLDRDDGLTPEEEARLTQAEKAFEAARIPIIPEADALWRTLTPTVDYIADNANIYSIKPLLMFDAAHISAVGGPGARTRLAVGGGLQFNVVIAKFELGYMRAVRRMPGDGRGNFVVRMVFEKLF